MRQNVKADELHASIQNAGSSFIVKHINTSIHATVSHSTNSRWMTSVALIMATVQRSSWTSWRSGECFYKTLVSEEKMSPSVFRHVPSSPIRFGSLASSQASSSLTRWCIIFLQRLLWDQCPDLTLFFSGVEGGKSGWSVLIGIYLKGSGIVVYLDAIMSCNRVFAQCHSL